MALKKPIENAQGYSPEYHRIAGVRFSNGKAHVEINSYKDAAARTANKTHVNTMLISVTAADDASRKELYELIKAAGPLKGASDI